MKITSPPQSTPLDLDRYLRQIAQQLNAITEGNMHAHHAAMTAAPTTGTWAQGDKVWNSEPAEAGAGGSKYIVIGWVCSVGGTPGTWLDMQVPTGN